MSAVVCGKRSYFEDSHSEWSPAKASKRVRCGGSPVHLIPSAPPFRSGPEGGARRAGSSTNLQDALEQLRVHFPNMDTQVMVKVLQTCENNVEAAIRCLTDLRLTPPGEEAVQASTLQSYAAAQSPSSSSAPQGSAAGPASPAGAPSGSAGPSSPPPQEGSDWVDLVVREMSAAANLDDARARAGKVLTEFEAVVRERVESGAGAAAKENGVLKEHMQALMKDNHILKRAVQIQNARQLESEEKMKEVHQLKQMLQQYQEQLRTLEVNNYALSLHLRKAQEQNCMPGRFHPDVF